MQTCHMTSSLCMFNLVSSNPLLSHTKSKKKKRKITADITSGLHWKSVGKGQDVCPALWDTATCVIYCTFRQKQQSPEAKMSSVVPFSQEEKE